MSHLNFFFLPNTTGYFPDQCCHLQADGALFTLDSERVLAEKMKILLFLGMCTLELALHALTAGFFPNATLY